MSQARRGYLALLAFGLSACAGDRPNQEAPGPADLVLRNGDIYTVDAARSWARAVAVRRGRIVFVGTDSIPAGLLGPSTEVIDLGGRMVLPGFQDGHVHPIDGGVTLGECTLDELTTQQQIIDSVLSCAETDRQAAWIRGSGWQLPVFAAANPSKGVLDHVVPDRPAILVAADGHSAWVNSKALSAAGITRDTPDPPNGRIERDRKTGEPSGTLREDAMNLVYRVVPERTPAELAGGLGRAQRLANSSGITSVLDASVDEAALRTYVAADRQKKLTLRVVAALNLGQPLTDSLLPKLKSLRAHSAGSRVQASVVKLFADGVIEARTAALLAPYLDRPGDRGKPIYDPEGLNRVAAALDREGFQIHVHAIGDRAVRMTLDAFAYARSRNGPHDARHTITHLELIDPADVPRFRSLDAVASFQAFWANGDEYLTKLTEPTLGPARSRWLYPIASIGRSAAMVAGGSDWSVSSINPLDAIEVGITHRPPDHPSQPAWHSIERVDLATMIAMYTINAAFALHQEHDTGSIEVGKLADLVVLDRNLFEVDPGEIHRVRVIRTLLEGKTVYESE